MRPRRGGQSGDENLAKFLVWLEERQLNNDWHLYARGEKLNRTEIAREIGCGVSALRQNRRIRIRLEWCERRLRREGILTRKPRPDLTELLDLEKASSVRSSRLVNDLKRKLQQLEARCAELESRNARMERALEENHIHLAHEDLVEDLLALFGTTPY